MSHMEGYRPQEKHSEKIMSPEEEQMLLLTTENSGVEGMLQLVKVVSRSIHS